MMEDILNEEQMLAGKTILLLFYLLLNIQKTLSLCIYLNSTLVFVAVFTKNRVHVYEALVRPLMQRFDHRLRDSGRDLMRQLDAYFCVLRRLETSSMEQAADGAEATAVDHYFSSSTENIFVRVCLWTSGRLMIVM